MTIEQSLAPLESDGGTLYYVPWGVQLGVHLMQLQPLAIGGAPLPVELRTSFGAAMLGGNGCLVQGALERYGRCTAVPPAYGTPALSGIAFNQFGGTILNGRLDAAASERHQSWPALGVVYGSSSGGTVPSHANGWRLDSLVVRTVLGARGAAATTELGASGSNVGDTSEAATFSTISLEETPASLVPLTRPPLSVRVGQPFLMKVQVRISSGSPVRGARVEALVVPATGETVTGYDFVTQQVGACSRCRAAPQSTPPARLRPSPNPSPLPILSSTLAARAHPTSARRPARMPLADPSPPARRSSVGARPQVVTTRHRSSRAPPSA